MATFMKVLVSDWALESALAFFTADFLLFL